MSINKAYIVPDRTEIKIGEIFQGKVIIAAFDTTKYPIILYNKERLPFSNGIGILRIKTTSKGFKNSKGEFAITFDDKNQTIKLPFDVKYNVK